MIIVVITGARSWENEKVIRRTLIQLTKGKSRGKFLIVVGGAPGVDTLVKQECDRLGIHTAVIEALWDDYGHAAGPMRNAVMLSLRPSLVLAFHWDIENESKGTKNCLEQAKRAGIPTKLVKPSKEIAMPSGFARKSKSTP